jgi:hypothetical protein
MTELLFSSGSGVSPLPMFADIKTYFFFVIGDPQTHKPA